MGVALYPRIENTDGSWAIDISGKALAKSWDKKPFKRLQKEGRKDLMDFYVPSPEDLEDHGAPPDFKIEWFNPIEGLALIDAMIQIASDHRDEFENPDYLEEDLKAFREILDRAASEGRRWNLAMDY